VFRPPSEPGEQTCQATDVADAAVSAREDVITVAPIAEDHRNASMVEAAPGLLDPRSKCGGSKVMQLTLLIVGADANGGEY